MDSPHRLPPPSNLSSELIDQRYRIQKLLGRGGFGQTYLAYDTHCFNHPCVLKEFSPTNRTEYVVQKARELFEREARVLYQINHPQIPQFLAWFVERDRLFLVQEYITGQTYAQLLRQRPPFSEAEVRRWLLNLLPVLDYLHQQQLVHRDISPDNVMQPNDPEALPMLIDFGLVKQSLSQIYQIQPGAAPSMSFVGKFGYAPPEQIRLGQCFPSSDLYALGVTALVLLTGQDSRLLMDQETLEWQWQDLVTISPQLAQVLNQMLENQPKARYQTAQDVLLALGAASPISLPPAVQPSIATPTQSPKPSPEFLQRCQQELTNRVGPIASFILDSALAQYPDANSEQIIEAISQEIPSSIQADSFRTTLQHSLNHSEAASSKSPNKHPKSASSSPQASPNLLSPDFLAHCQQVLTRCIGPMANLILDEILMQSPQTPQTLVDAIVAEIPDPQQARTFRAMMKG
jgi:serine/threonine protein kinase